MPRKATPSSTIIDMTTVQATPRATPPETGGADTLPASPAGAASIEPAVSAARPVPGAKPGTKLGQVMDALQRPQGATLADLARLTGWQPHSVRAALSGLRKAGHAVTTRKDKAGATVYRIVAREEPPPAATDLPAAEPRPGAGA